MRHHLVVLGWLVLAALGSSCDGGGGPATSPIAPFGAEPAPVTGAEPTGSGNEAPPPTGGGGDSIQELCGRVCVRVEAACPAASGGAGCAADCASSDFAGCETEFRAFLTCFGSATLSCQGDTLEAPGCEAITLALGNCISPQR